MMLSFAKADPDAKTAAETSSHRDKDFIALPPVISVCCYLKTNLMALVKAFVMEKCRVLARRLLEAN
ncbi:hypothetical protein [Azospirillum sp. sgz301742]